MPLSKLVVKMYAAIIEVALWLVVLGAVVGGWRAGGVVGALGALIAATILAAVLFGAFLVLEDIRTRVRAIEQRPNS
jgi:hypothetical protein